MLILHHIKILEIVNNLSITIFYPITHYKILFHSMMQECSQVTSVVFKFFLVFFYNIVLSLLQ